MLNSSWFLPLSLPSDYLLLFSPLFPATVRWKKKKIKTLLFDQKLLMDSGKRTDVKV